MRRRAGTGQAGVGLPLTDSIARGTKWGMPIGINRRGKPRMPERPRQDTPSGGWCAPDCVLPPLQVMMGKSIYLITAIWAWRIGEAGMIVGAVAATVEIVFVLEAVVQTEAFAG
jgi:hypothetical protein